MNRMQQLLYFVLIGVIACWVNFSCIAQNPVRSLAKNKCVDCHQKEVEQFKAARVVHHPVSINLCQKCHRPHGDAGGLYLTDSKSTLCCRCHIMEFNKRHVHAPVKNGDCTICHDPHSSKFENLLTKRETELCFMCHLDDAFNKRHVHAPVEEGRCTACHNPHASNYDKYLDTTENMICKKCHVLGILFNASHSAYDIKDGQCVSCHTPHSSSKNNMLRETIPIKPITVLSRTVPTLVSWRAPRKTRILSVGVGDFKDTAIPKIDYAESDARGFACLAKSSGIPEENISHLTNKDACRNAITDALIKLKMATTESSETAIFYFSGHGAPIVKNGKIVDTALVPYDAGENSLEYTGIKISTLRELLSDTRGNWIVILDACFSGREGRSLMAKNIKGICVVPKNFNVAAKSAKNNWWITATSGDNFANDFPKENHGLFTYYFLKALNGEKGVDANEDGLISMKEAFNWTKKEVSAVSAKSLGRLQVPELIGKGDTILTIPR